MHAHRVEGENEVGWVLIFDGVGDSYGIPRKVMMDTQARGGMSWMSLIELDITGRHGFGLHWFVYGLGGDRGPFLGRVSTRKTKGHSFKGTFQSLATVMDFDPLGRYLSKLFSGGHMLTAITLHYYLLP